MERRDKRQAAWYLRRNMTPAERLLWSELRDDRLEGFHFRRQHVIAGLIADFYCHAARLVIEVDGPVHERLRESDAERDRVLAGLGVCVLHVTNDRVTGDMSAVLAEILAIARERSGMTGHEPGA